MATASAQVIELPRTRKKDTETWDDLITRYGQAFIAIESREDATSWEKAQLVKEFDEDTSRHPEMQDKPRHEISKRANRDLRAWLGTQRKNHVRPSFMAHARRVFNTWEDIAFESNILPYNAYMQMAACGLPRDQKEELRRWAEAEQPTQSELRQTIRQRVDERKGIYTPDFELKVSNHWMFNSEKRHDGFVGGVNKELYANLVHFFSDPGDTILDPFAGGGVLAEALKLKHFQAETKAEHGGPRYALMSDLKPQRSEIVQADVRLGLPFADQCAQLAILDPPYLTMAAGKYAELGKVLAEWLDGLRAAMAQTARCLTPDGILVVMTDDHLRRDQHIPLGHKVMALAEAEGWQLLTTIYNFNRNFIINMTPGAMIAVKNARFPVNAVKIIMVMRRVILP